jgi:hypothetical protein
MRTRDYRRAQDARVKARWGRRLDTRDMRYSLTWMGSTPGVNPWTDRPTRIGKAAATPQAPCECCSNRRASEGPTMGERRNAITFSEEV